jgi:hypothetical protein
MGIREALRLREGSPEHPTLCTNCGIRHRYGPLELARAAYGYARSVVVSGP